MVNQLGVFEVLLWGYIHLNTMDDDRNQMMQAVRTGRRLRNAALMDYEKELDVKFAAMFALMVKHCASVSHGDMVKMRVAEAHPMWGHHHAQYLQHRFEDTGCKANPVKSCRDSKGWRLELWCPGVKK